MILFSIITCITILNVLTKGKEYIRACVGTCAKRTPTARNQRHIFCRCLLPCPQRPTPHVNVGPGALMDMLAGYIYCCCYVCMCAQ